MQPSNSAFIPAKESKWFIFLFDLYVRNLFWRRFKNIRFDQHYQPSPESKTIYYLNHTSWWDGLIPLLLNRKLFRQNARAMMEDNQMKQYPFFKRIGAFSVDLSDRGSSVKSLRYAVKSMDRPNASLFIYPQGKITPFQIQNLDFKKGLGWITGHCQDADIVPVGVYITTARFAKPELFIRIGKKVKVDYSMDTTVLNEIFNLELQKNLAQLQKYAVKKPGIFQKL